MEGGRMKPEHFAAKVQAMQAATATPFPEEPCSFEGLTEPGTLENGSTGEETETVKPPTLLTCFADIPQAVVPWLWHGWLVEGGFHILAGAGSTGKTTIALSLAATITTGGMWPDGTRCESPGNVLIWSSEDDPSYTIGPRLVAAGADLNQCHFVGGVGQNRLPFDPATDLGKLEAEIERIGGARFLLIDPIVSVVQCEGNSNPKVRRALQPLADLGQRFGCAVLGISHFNKGSSDNAPTDRVNGSLAYTALARVVMGTVRRKAEDLAEGDLPCLLLRTKGNLAKDSDSGGFQYGPEEVEIPTDAKRASRTLWGKATTGTASELLQEAEAPTSEGGESAIKEAKDWLRDLLGFEEVESKEVKAAAKIEGFGDKTLRNARVTLGVEIRREGSGKEMRSLWSLPTGNRPFVPQNPFVPTPPSEGMNEEKGTNDQIPMPFLPEGAT
jgi:putative DNA primase/helicase